MRGQMLKQPAPDVRHPKRIFALGGGKKGGRYVARRMVLSERHRPGEDIGDHGANDVMVTALSKSVAEFTNYLDGQRLVVQVSQG